MYSNIMENYTNATINSTLNGDNAILFTEQFSVGARLAFLLVGLLALVINIPAIIVLRKTKKIPYTGKFLSSGLLLFDALFIFFSTLRKFYSDPMVNVTLQLLGTSANGLSVISVSMMAAERYVLFFYPMKYLKYVTDRLTRILACTTWAGYLFGHWLLRYGVCYAKLQTLLVFKQAGICNDIVLRYMLICVTITTIVCSYSYANIIAFVYRKTKAGASGQPRHAMRRALILEYKSTMFVFMCTGVMCLSFVAYGIILALNVTKTITIEQNRIAFESVSIMNCIMDPLWYVLWFKECRLEGLKILAFFNRKLLPKVERMRIEIFNIVTSVPCGSNAIIEECKGVTKAASIISQTHHIKNERVLKNIRRMNAVSPLHHTRWTMDNDLRLESLDGETFSVHI